MLLSLAEQIHQAALSCGFENCGIIPLEAMDGFSAYLQKRKENVPSSKPFYGGMDSMAQTKERFPWAKSIVICTYWYGKYKYPRQLQGRYAKDYFLKPESSSFPGCDELSFEARLGELGLRYAGGSQFQHTSIGPLRYAAMQARLGIIRKNNFFYTEKGSHYCLIGYVIDQACELIHQTQLKPCSDTCNLCQLACKTKALSAPYSMDPLKCVSFWTSFGKGIVPPHLKADMFEEWICGCDNCQDACPYNQKHNWDEGESFSDLEELAEDLIPEKILAHSDEYLIEHVISKSDNHLKPSEAAVIRRNAKRAILYHHVDCIKR